MRTICKFHIKPIRRRTKASVPKRVNVRSLVDDYEVQTKFQEALASKLNSLDQSSETSINEQWRSISAATHEVMLENLEPPPRRNADWFDENNESIQSLLHERTAARNEMLNIGLRSKAIKFKELKRKVQSSLRQMKDDWWNKKLKQSKTLQKVATIEPFLNLWKRYMDPVTQSPLHSSTNLEQFSWLIRSMLWTDGKNIFRISSIDHLPLTQMHWTTKTNCHPILTWISLHLWKKLKMLSSLWRMVKLLEQMEFPQKYMNMVGPVLFKFCTLSSRPAGMKLNYPKTSRMLRFSLSSRKETALSVVTIVESHCYQLLAKYLPRSYCPGYNKLQIRYFLKTSVVSEPTDPTDWCNLHSLSATGKSIEQQRPLFMVFIDFTKAFDTVNRELMWKLLDHFGCPKTFTKIIREFHEGMQATVLVDGDLTEAFPVCHGVKQGCILAPTLFGLYLAAVLEASTDNVCDAQRVVYLRSRTDGKLFNLARLRASPYALKCVCRNSFMLMILFWWPNLLKTCKLC